MGILGLSLNKRTRIIISSAVLSLTLLVTWFMPAVYLLYKVHFIAGLAILTYTLSVWSLWEGMSKLRAFVLMILPTFFTLAIVNYYFLLQASWTSIPFAVFFGLIFYTLLLSQNIFNVASNRAIPLYRVAFVTIFILTLLTAFALFNVIFSLELFFIGLAGAVFLVVFPLILQVLWTIDMEDINGLILSYSFISSLVVAEIALGLAFWPIYRPLGALALTIALFVTLGISTHTLRDRLTRGVVWEYLGWGAAIFLIAFFTTSWTG